MRLKTRTKHITRVRISCGNLTLNEMRKIRHHIDVMVGAHKLTYRREGTRAILEWDRRRMGYMLRKSSVSILLAEGVALMPTASSHYLELIGHIIEDWQTVDRTVEHDQSERCAQVIEILAKKRDEIRENLREEPYLKAPVINIERGECVTDECIIAAVNSSLSASEIAQ